MHGAISINTLSLDPAPLAAQVDAVARIGARAISPEVSQLDAAGFRALHDSGLAVATISHRAFGFATAAETAAARDRLARTIEIAAQAGAQTVTMTTGGRGDLSWPEAASRFAEAIAPCAEAARAAGVAIGIEPTSHLYADTSIVHRLSDAVAVAKRAGISVMIELFPCWTDADLDRSLADAAPLCPLIQVSDYVYGDRGLPCRAVPGDGAVPFGRIVPALVAAGFSGWWDLEIIGPRIEAEGRENGLRRAAAHVGGLLEQAGVAG